MYGHVITKFSRMGSLPYFLSHGAPQARFARQSSAKNLSKRPDIFSRPLGGGRNLVGMKSLRFVISWEKMAHFNP